MPTDRISSFLTFFIFQPEDISFSKCYFKFLYIHLPAPGLKSIFAGLLFFLFGFYHCQQTSVEVITSFFVLVSSRIDDDSNSQTVELCSRFSNCSATCQVGKNLSYNKGANLFDCSQFDDIVLKVAISESRESFSGQILGSMVA